MTDTIYYEAKETGDGYFRGRLYRWDETGNHEITVHQTIEFDSASEAINQILDYADANDIECYN